MTDPITLTALGGYLGAGKTTLLNEILAAPPVDRIALVINDFGDINIDAELVRARSADTLQLTNGCVCCNLSDGMATTMRRIRAMAPAPQLAVVEVSGVGDPSAVSAWGELPGFRRGGALLCVDPGTVQRHAADRWVGDTVRDQIERADAIVLTKRDVRPADELLAVRSWLRDRFPGVRLVDRADVSAMLLDGFGSATQQRVSMAERTAAAHVQRHTAWSVTFDIPVSAADLLEVLGELPEAVERVKGIVPIVTDGEPRRALINRAGGDFVLQDDGRWDGTAGRLVLIAPGPPRTVPDPSGDLKTLARQGCGS